MEDERCYFNLSDEYPALLRWSFAMDLSRLNIVAECFYNMHYTYYISSYLTSERSLTRKIWNIACAFIVSVQYISSLESGIQCIFLLPLNYTLAARTRNFPFDDSAEICIS